MLKNFSKLRFALLAKKSNFLFSLHNNIKYSFSLQITKEQKEEINNKLNSNEKYSQKFFEEYAKLLPITKIGLQNLDKRVFQKALDDAAAPQDIEAILNLVAEFTGHHKPLTGNKLDELVKKSIQFDAVSKLIPLFKNHRAIQYYPHPSLIEEIVESYLSKNDYKGLKEVFSSMMRRHYLQKSVNVYNKVIDLAHKNKDYEFVVECFLDILDPKESLLEARLYNVVLVSNEKFVKDKPLKELIETLVENNKFTNTGSLIAFAVFELLNKNLPKYEEYIIKINASLSNLNSGNSNNNAQIPESDAFKKILEQVITEKADEKILDLLKNDAIKQQVFDPSYAEVLSKLQ